MPHDPASIPSQPTTATTPDEALTPHELDERPWKYIGYWGYSAFLASDSDFCNFRRFERLNTRVMLALQDELVQIEDSLEAIDKSCSTREAGDIHNGTFRHDEQEKRVSIICEARQKLEAYNRFIYRYIQLRERTPATKRDITSLQNWFFNHPGAIQDEERKYIEQDDLFALIPKDRSPLRRVFERFPGFRLSRFWRQEPSSGLPLHVRQHIHYASDKRIDQFMTLTIMVTGLIMIITPLWALEFTHPPVLKLAVITVFILLFLVLVSVGSNAKPYEVLAATAGYSAVLMVFIQLGGQDAG